MHHPLRLRCNRAALAANYQRMRAIAGVATGAAVKADGYGLGAAEVVRTLLNEGCRDFFVSTWAEAEDLAFLPSGCLAVLHGFGPDDSMRDGTRPVLISADQVRRWRVQGGGMPCDVMVDTGMNRLGLSLDEIAALEGLEIHTLHSHLACADEEHALNAKQLQLFSALRDAVPAGRYSLSNSAGIWLGRAYAFDLVRPGLGLYGGIPRPESRDHIEQVFKIDAQVLQMRSVKAGESVGYNATYVANCEHPVAIINIGYADGYWRQFSNRGLAFAGDAALPVIGRVSMDLVALDASAAPELVAGNWVSLDFDLECAAKQTGYSQYELLTGLGRRFERHWF